MDEWKHKCARDGRVLMVPAGEVCNRCGCEPPGDHYFDRLEAWLGWGQPAHDSGVKACVATHSRCPDVREGNVCSLPDGACDGQRTRGVRVTVTPSKMGMASRELERQIAERAAGVMGTPGDKP